MLADPPPLLTLALEQGGMDLSKIRADPTLADDVTELLRAMTAGTGQEPLPADAVCGPLFDLATRLLWGRRHDALQALVETLMLTPSAAGPLLRAYAQLDELTAHGVESSGTTEQGLPEVARTLLAGADAALERGDLTRCTALASAALWVLFHPELHDSRPTSALVEDPQRWLEPLRTSRVGRLLTGSVSPTQASATTTTRAVVLTGCYPRFAAPVVKALREQETVPVSAVSMSEVDKPFRRMAVEPWVVDLRLRAGLGQQIDVPKSLRNALAGADAVLADWADAAAVLASLVASPRSRLIVRLHSVDALRCWMHLIDWSAVDTLVCVGPHIQALVRAQLGGRLAGCSLRVLPNIVDLPRFNHPRSSDTDRTLAMVGWGRAVKDPLWTVELLAHLLAREAGWRLLLVGHPFDKVLPPTGQAYAERFDQRIASPDVATAITKIPFTSDLGPVLARAGWVVSSSIRESWGVGPVEAVAAGAFPVIRDWPLLVRWGGARTLYPKTWVVGSVEEAARSMLATVRNRQRETLAEEARQLLHRLVDPFSAARAYRELVLGPPTGTGPADG